MARTNVPLWYVDWFGHRISGVSLQNVIICRCFHITREEIEERLEQGDDLDSIQSDTGVGCGCGGCMRVVMKLWGPNGDPNDQSVYFNRPEWSRGKPWRDDHPKAVSEVVLRHSSRYLTKSKLSTDTLVCSFRNLRLYGLTDNNHRWIPIRVVPHFYCEKSISTIPCEETFI